VKATASDAGMGIGERIAPAVFADVSIDVGEVFA
jgi:hypothetical protein